MGVIPPWNAHCGTEDETRGASVDWWWARGRGAGLGVGSMFTHSQIPIIESFSEVAKSRALSPAEMLHELLWHLLKSVRMKGCKFDYSFICSLIHYSTNIAAAAAKSLQSCPTLQPHRQQPTRLPHPWDSPGKNTGVGSTNTRVYYQDAKFWK